MRMDEPERTLKHVQLPEGAPVSLEITHPRQIFDTGRRRWEPKVAHGLAIASRLTLRNPLKTRHLRPPRPRHALDARRANKCASVRVRLASANRLTNALTPLFRVVWREMVESARPGTRLASDATPGRPPRQLLP